MEFSQEILATPTKEFADAVNIRRSMGGRIISLGLGEPDLKTPEYIIDATTKAIYDGYTNYCSALGLKELRVLIAEDASKMYNNEITLNEVVITPGIKSAVYSALAAIIEPNDKVGMITPCYIAYPAMIKMAEPTARIIPIDLNKDFTFNIDKIVSTIESGIKCLIINSPNNPTGAIIKYSDMKIIVDKCLEYKVYLLSDEVYDKMTFFTNKHISFGEFPEIKDYLIIANGYSKSHAMTGWRLGYAIAPKWICDRVGKIQFNTNTNTCTFIQKGACSIYYNEQGHIAPYVEELEQRISFFHDAINKMQNIEGIKPKGGFFYFANIEKSKLTSNQYCAKLVVETGIACTPGIAFGESWDNYIRFSLAVPMQTIKEAVVLLKEFDLKLG